MRIAVGPSHWWLRAGAARRTAQELRRTRRLLRHGNLADTHRQVRPLHLAPERLRVVMTTRRVLRASCLERALILQAWRQELGDPRDVVIGVGQPKGRFAAHAWLEGHGGESGEGFVELLRLPPPSAAG